MRTPWITARLAESDKLIGVGIASAQPTFLALIAWRVERMHNWMQRCQCLLIRWDKQMRNYLGGLHVACAYIMLPIWPIGIGSYTKAA
jgi:hypothetical protein